MNDRATDNIETVVPDAALPPFDDPKYLALLDADVSQEEATAFLRELNALLVTCVDIGFGVDAVQLAVPELAQSWELSQEDAEFSGQQESSQVKKEDNTANFNSVAENDPPQEDDER